MPPKGPTASAPKRGRARTLTYNLTGANAKEAFEEELELEEQAKYRAATGAKAGGSRWPARAAFSLLADLPNATHGDDDGLEEYGSARATTDMINLLELFGATCDRGLIEAVYFGADNFDIAMAQLLDMGSGAADTVSVPPPAAPDPDADDAPPDAEPLSELRSGDDAGANGGVDGPYGGVSHWEMLPPELKHLILGVLNTRDLARAARTCRDFAVPARAARTNARQLVLPTGVGMMGIISMVAGHTNARSVSLKQWASTPLREEDFTALIVAISQGSRSERRAVPVEAISFRACAWMTDGYVMQLCDTLQHLKEVDLSDCKGITDLALTTLSKYTRYAGIAAYTTGDGSDDDDDGGGGGGCSGGDAWATGGTNAAAADAADLDPDELPADFGIDEESVAGGASGTSDTEADDELPSTSTGAATPLNGLAAGMARMRLAPAGMATPPPPPPALGASLDLDSIAQAAGAGSVGAAAPCGGRPPLGLGVRQAPAGAAGAASAGTPPSAPRAPWAAAAGPPPQHDDTHGRMGPASRSGSYSSIGLGTPLNDALWPAASPSPAPLLGASPPSGAGPSRAGGSAYGSLPRTESWKAGSHWLYGSSPVMGSSPYFRTGSASAHNTWLARAAASATSTNGGRGLMSINISGCAAISSDGVRTLLSAAIPKACLLQLDISRCPRITRAALVLPPTSNLCVLRASGCHNLHEVIMTLSRASPLTELHVSDCKALTKLHVVAPALQQLHVGGCRHLTRLTLRCPAMRHLTASLCFRLSSFDAEGWDCPRLEHVNFFGCRHLEWPSLQALLARSPQLRHLDINGCNALGVADIAENDLLHSVDVSGCKALTALRCSSPALQQLTARACPRLVEVVLDSSCLVQLDIARCPVLSRISMPALQDVPQQQPAVAGASGLGPAAAAVAGTPQGQARGGIGGGLAGPSGAWASRAAKDGVVVRMAGCERLPGDVVARLRQLRERAKAVAAATAAAAAAAAAAAKA